MAKVKSTIATSIQGRIGNIGFRRAAGQRIIAAELPALVTNPRTSAQMSQRVKLAALVSFYRASKGWMPKAWQSKEAKQTNYNAFVRANLASSPVAFTKDEAAQGAAVCYPWIVAQGSLPPVEFSASGSVYVSNLFLGNFSINESTTIGEISEALLNNNMSLRENDQVSVIIYQQGAGPGGVPYVTCSPYELVIDTTSTALLSTVWPSAVQSAAAVGSAAVAINTATITGGFAIIVSRKNGGTLEVSKAALICPSDTTYGNYVTQIHQALAAYSYGAGTEVFLDPTSVEVKPYNNTGVTRNILGAYYGADAPSSVYYPVGGNLANRQAEAETGQYFGVKVTDTANLASSGALIVQRENQAGTGWQTIAEFEDLTVTSSVVGGLITAASTYYLVGNIRAILTYADGQSLIAEWTNP